jgi:uncharacterized membrane protein HdeD (DUF308 family)
MNNFLWGILYLTSGIFLTKRQIKVFKNKESDKYGFNLNLLLLGLLIIMIGIFFIFDIGIRTNSNR